MSSSLQCLLFEKTLKLGLLNTSKNTEGTLINNLQIDCEHFSKTLTFTSYTMRNLITLLFICVALGVWLFRWPFLIFIAVSLLAILPVYSVIKLKAWLKRQWMTLKDGRMSFFRNLSGIVRFVKVNARENWWFAEVEDLRQKELRYQLFKGFAGSFFISCFILAPLLASSTFLYFYFKAGYSLEASKVIVFINMISR